MPDIAALILAAGASSRMGQPKQLCQFNGRSFLRNTADLCMAAHCSPIVAVLQSAIGPIAEELADLRVTIAENPHWEHGMGTSIRCGMAWLLHHSPPPSHLLIILCDQPLVTADHLQQLVIECLSANKPIAVTFDGVAETPPVLIAASLYPQLLTIPDDCGAKFIWKDHPDWVHRVPCPPASIDIDTQENYQSLIERKYEYRT